MESRAPAIQRIRTAPDGTLWVLPGRGTKDQAPGVHSTWDVFAPDGTFLHQAALACGADGEKDAVFFGDDGRLFVVKEHADALRALRGGAGGAEDGDEDAAPLEVICYRILP